MSQGGRPVPTTATGTDLSRAYHVGVGSVEQWVDDVDVLMDAGRRVAAARAVTG